MNCLKLSAVNKEISILAFTLAAVMLCAGSFGGGCSRAPEDPAWFQSTTTGEALPADQLRLAINRTESVFDLQRMKREYILRGGVDRAVIAELDRRREEILTEQPELGSPGPKVDLLAFDYLRVGPGRYRAEYLFRARQPLPADLRISIYGGVLPEDIDSLSPAMREAGRRSEVWAHRPVPSADQWEVGEYIYISHHLQGADIPYSIALKLYQDEAPGSEDWDWVYLGWRRGDSGSSLLDRINRAVDIFELYRLEGDCWSCPIAQEAFEKRSARLLEKITAPGKISEEAELRAFDYRKIGENRYRVDYLFCLARPLEYDCAIYLYGKVDEAHLDLLSEARRRDTEVWGFHPFPRTHHWPAGRCVLISHGIDAQPIPYNMSTSFWDPGNRRRHGERISLGWRADPGHRDPE